MRFHSKRGHASPVNPALRRGGASATVQLRRPRARPLLVGTPSTASATWPARSGTRSNASVPEQARAVVVRPKSSREQNGSKAAHLQLPWLRDDFGVACTTHVPCMYLACTSHVPRMYLTCTSHVPGLHFPIPSQAHGLDLACTTHVPGFGPLWPGLHPSSFILHPSLRGRIEAALGWLWGGFRLA